MLKDDLHEQLKNITPDIQTIISFWNNAQLEKKFQTLEAFSKEEEFWKNPQQTDILKELQHIRILRDQYFEIITSNTELTELVNLFADSEYELSKISSDITALRKKVIAFKIHLLLNEPNDSANCFVHIHAGAGGTESQDWANILLRMYYRFCERNNLNVDTIDYQSGEEAGIKSVTLFVHGKNSYGYFKSEHGIHRLVRISPFDSNKRRHTSFTSVMVTPEVPDITVTIDPKDLRIDTYRASGAGGQHVNKTDSAVRITHLPTNIVVQCQNERSQQQNKAFAMKMLYAKLAQKTKDEQDAKRSAGIEKRKIEWGSQIRSYVLHPYKMIKDHRTDFESSQPDKVLDGELIDFIESFLVWRSATL
ncbi:MAG TPA: peptide chain release factor 2 [Candidatus Babeliales bacterium]|nr:peptide chain release factor 2 [Candidatus Babeliales bacterium]